MSTLAANRQLVLIASSMRSGSTLLKALLAEAPDVSNLNEVNFQAFANSARDHERMWRLSPRRILVLKRPAWYHEVKSYPRLPAVDNCKVILLVRDVYPTVESLRKMSLWKFAGKARPSIDRWLARSYWLPITRRLLELGRSAPQETKLVRYEDLIARPIEVTRELFGFIGSGRREGTDSYSEPVDRRWRWGVDDASPNIRSLRVQPPRATAVTNPALQEYIATHTEIRTVRHELGYEQPTNPGAPNQ